MTIEENWALPAARIADYLRGIDGVRQIAEARYEIGGCEIALRPLEESKVGSYSFPRALVIFTGNEDAVSQFRRQFTLHFLTLGG